MQPEACQAGFQNHAAVQICCIIQRKVLQGSFGENIELAITNFFRFDVSVITNISVCEARSVYLNTLNTSEHSEAHKQHARLFTGYFPSSISKLSKVIREKIAVRETSSPHMPYTTAPAKVYIRKCAGRALFWERHKFPPSEIHAMRKICLHDFKP